MTIFIGQNGGAHNQTLRLSTVLLLDWDNCAFQIDWLEGHIAHIYHIAWKYIHATEYNTATHKSSQNNSRRGERRMLISESRHERFRVRGNVICDPPLVAVQFLDSLEHGTGSGSIGRRRTTYTSSCMRKMTRHGAAPGQLASGRRWKNCNFSGSALEQIRDHFSYTNGGHLYSKSGLRSAVTQSITKLL